jgi:carbonic anhydrase/acetyltransferase-like protein (isoleucine patch superfamily)
MAAMRKIGEYYLADNATVLGDVVIHPGANVWYGCILRGDVARLTLGRNVNLQDGVIMHADFGHPHEIEEGVVVGHGAILHGRRIGRGSLIGMAATVLGGAVIGEECIVAAGCLVPEDMVIPPRSLVRGLPAKVVRAVSDEEVRYIRGLNEHYLRLSREHAQGRYPPGGAAAMSGGGS